MRRTLRSMMVIVLAMVLVAVWGVCRDGNARNGGGSAVRGGGFSGGSFRGADLPRGGGEYNVDQRLRPGGGERRSSGTYDGARDGRYVEPAAPTPVGPVGQEASDGRGVRQREDDGYYYHGNWYPDDVSPRAAFIAGAAVGLAVGSTVATLPAAYATIMVGDQTYYVSDGTYYQPCFVGAVASYCVVDAPN